MTVLLTGFLTCLALIVAIGPQAAFLLRQGLRRDRVLLAVACCLVGDILLISLGTAGVGALLDHAPWMLEVLRWLGVAYILWFAYRSFRSAFTARPGAGADDDSSALSPGSSPSGPSHTVHVAMTSEIPMLNPDGTAPAQTSESETATMTAARQRVHVTHVSKVSTVAGTALTLSILNPHAWVDSLVVLGTMANSFAEDRWFFAAGAIVACVLWHALLAGGGSALAGLLNRPRTWQVIDVIVGVTMVGVAAMLVLQAL